MLEREHIINVLKEVKQALNERDYVRIKSLSNQVVHTSSIEQDPDVVSVAVIIYSLGKLIEREKYKQYSNWENFYKSYLKTIDNLIKTLEKNNIEAFRNEISSIRELIQKLSGHLKIYINEVFRKTKINKASRIYEHGISMEQTAKILGISIWELAEYAGQTGISDVDLSITLPIKQRIKLAEEFFNEKTKEVIR